MSRPPKDPRDEIVGIEYDPGKGPLDYDEMREDFAQERKEEMEQYYIDHQLWLKMTHPIKKGN